MSFDDLEKDMVLCCCNNGVTRHVVITGDMQPNDTIAATINDVPTILSKDDLDFKPYDYDKYAPV
jgi:hypothetical protein